LKKGGWRDFIIINFLVELRKGTIIKSPSVPLFQRGMEIEGFTLN